MIRVHKLALFRGDTIQGRTLHSYGQPTRLKSLTQFRRFRIQSQSISTEPVRSFQSIILMPTLLPFIMHTLTTVTPAQCECVC